jgi:hypothetical protein
MYFRIGVCIANVTKYSTSADKTIGQTWTDLPIRNLNASANGLIGGSY